MISSERLAGFVDVHETSVRSPDRRVLFVTSMWPDAGRPHYGPFVATQAQSLEALGIGVDVIAIRGYESAWAYAAARPVVSRFVRCRVPDVVHVHTGHAATVGLPGVPVPTVVSFVGGDLLGHPTGPSLSRKSRVEMVVFRQLAALADATITKSRQMEEALPHRLRSANHVIPNGVDVERFKPVARAAARASLGWKDHDHVALFVGDPSDARKNVTLARDCVERYRAGGGRIRLHEAWGVHPDTMPALMAASDALIFPSLSEGSPNVIKEAMAAGLPIVATDVGDVRDRLDGLASCYVEPRTVERFAAALAQAVCGPRADGAREAIAALSLSLVAERVAAVYDVAIAAHQNSGGVVRSATHRSRRRRLRRPATG